VNGNEHFDSLPGSGAVYLFLKETGWGQKAYIKSPVSFSDANFGRSIDFAEEDARLIITQPGFRAGAPGAVLLY
jgi:hypothetical protein